MVRWTLVILMGIGLCNPALAQTNVPPKPSGDVMTLKKTLNHVYQKNPTLQASRYGLEATRELYPQATSGWKPNVNAETSITSTDVETGNFAAGDGATTKSASIQVDQPLFRGFRTVAETESAERRIDAGLADVKSGEQRIFLQTAESYMNVVRDRLILMLRQKNRELLEKEQESVNARFDAGDVTQTDVKQTEAKYAISVASEAIAQSDLRESEAIFEKVTGLFPSGTMEVPVVDFKFPSTLDELVKAADVQNPQLMGIRQAHLAAQSDIRTAKSDYYPYVTAFASHVKEYDPQPGIVSDSETSAIGVRARINLYEGGNTISRTREAKSRANQRLIEIRETEMAIKSDLVTSWRKLQSADSEISARELAVAASKYSRDGVHEEARLGERTVLDTLDAEQDVLDSETALVIAKREKVVTAYRLAAALGMLSPEQVGIAASAGREPLE